MVSKPDKFRYKAGDYVFVRIPGIAKYEWHPFTISSAPELKGNTNGGQLTRKCSKYCEKGSTAFHPIFYLKLCQYIRKTC